MEYVLIGISAVLLVLVIVCILQINSLKKQMPDQSASDQQLTEKIHGDIKETEVSLQREIRESRQETLEIVTKQFSENAMQNEQKLEQIRATMESKIKALTEDNNRQLEQMRNTVDEKLQKTLEDRISQSFKLVSERLEQVYKGLGEMQNLASGVGDLKKVLSNVKTRGILGEIQLGAIMEQIMSPEQYEENVKTTSSDDRVEFAVKLPGDDDSVVYLPIDAKFHGDTYGYLRDAIESGDAEQIELYSKQLEVAIKKSAKDIHDKYIEPPNTTDFAIMFLPFEGLYAEVLNRRGLVEQLQRDYKVSVAGPTTMAALLNSLQMGFKTLAIQKRSGEVWNTLAAVKTEFGRFEGVLDKARKKIEDANSELEKLVGTRTRMMYSKLKNIEKLDGDVSSSILGLDGLPDIDAEDE